MKLRVGPRSIELSRIVPKVSRLFRAAAFSRRLENPFEMTMCYLRRTSPDIVRFRDGMTIDLSSHPHDLVTVFVVFCFEEYGEIERDSVVLDVGGNVGVFALYAAASGASEVHVYEPNKEAYKTLVRNVEANGLEGVVRPFNAAVGAETGTGRMPVEASPYNQVSAEAGENDQMQAVVIESLTTVVDRFDADAIDLVKLDCEGAEFEIIGAIDGELSKGIRRVRMEYEPERGSITEAIDHLTTLNFDVTLHTTRPNRLWFDRV